MENKEQEKKGFVKFIPLLVLSLALAIIIIDGSVLNVSISKIIVDLNTDLQQIQWVIASYSLVIAALTIVGGRLGDFFGRKKMFILGAIIFAIGSFISSISTNVGMLQFGWSLIEGIGAALMMPATTSLLISTYHGRDRGIAFGIWGGVAAAASAFGPIVGGYLTTNATWNWAFRINVFIVMILIAGSVYIKESIDRKEKKELDVLGVLLSSTGLVAIVFGIIKASTYGWWIAKEAFVIFDKTINFSLPFGNLSITPITIAFGIILLILFALWEKRREISGHTPLVSLALFEKRTYTAGSITTMILSLGQAGIIFAVPVFLQSVRHLNAFDTGIALLPLSLAVLITAPLSAVLAQKISGKWVIVLGLFINLAATFVLRYEIGPEATATTMIPGLLLYGAGMGFVMAQISNITLSAVEPYQAGEASGVNSTVRQIGSSLGSAIIGAIFLSAFTSSLVTGINESKIIPTQAKTSIVSAVEKGGSSLEFGGASTITEKYPVAMKEEFSTLIVNSTVAGNKSSLLIAALFTVMGLVSAMYLPTIKPIGKNDKSESSEAIVSVH